MIQRRSFLGAILAAATAPVFIQRGVLMPVKVISDTGIVGIDYAPGRFIKHVGLDFGFATTKLEGQRIFYEPLPEYGVVYPLRDGQKLPPGWEFCDAKGKILEQYA